MRYAAEVSYDGGRFFGWQIQPDLPTVQQALEEAASALNGGHTNNVAGAGRTDTGVHARAQICTFDMKREWEPRSLMLAMNAHLPPGVSVMRTARVADDFHARFSALKREYRYFIWNASSIYPHAKPYAAWLKHGGYDWAAAAAAAKFLEGEHDFRNFCASKAASTRPCGALNARGSSEEAASSYSRYAATDSFTTWCASYSATSSSPRSAKSSRRR